MSQQFSYSTATSLPRDRVWKLLIDIEQWTKCSEIYTDLRWSGFPWVTGGCILGRLNYPTALTFRYVVQAFEPPRLIRYIAHSINAGFAAELTIRLTRLEGKTSIHVDAFTVGELTTTIPGGSLGLLKVLIERWFQDFARFCDQHAQAKAARPASQFTMLQSLVAAVQLPALLGVMQALLGRASRLVQNQHFEGDAAHIPPNSQREPDRDRFAIRRRFQDRGSGPGEGPVRCSPD